MVSEYKENEKMLDSILVIVSLKRKLMLELITEIETSIFEEYIYSKYK